MVLKSVDNYGNYWKCACVVRPPHYLGFLSCVTGSILRPYNSNGQRF